MKLLKIFLVVKLSVVWKFWKMQISLQFFTAAVVEPVLVDSVVWTHKKNYNSISSNLLDSAFLVIDIKEILSAGLFSDMLLIIENNFNLWRK